MLNNVSWATYLEAVVILLVIYYLVIVIKIYPEKIKSKLWRKPRQEEDIEREQVQAVTTIATVEELEAVTDDLRYAIFEKAGKNSSKPELLRQLKQRLANYGGLKKPAYRVALNNYIMLHAKDTCGITFSEEELNSEWD